jgi:hypothetical protein
MDTLSPEILHIVCAFLDVRTILNFRLVSKAFADIGGPYLLPQVSFYMHRDEFARLRAIAGHPTISKGVRSLTYFAEVMDKEIVSMQEFVNDYYRDRADDLRAASYRQLSKPLTIQELKNAYRQYEATMKAQQQIIDNQDDINCLKEVIPKFTSLREATMSAGQEFYEGRAEDIRESPFRKSPRWPGHDLDPEGQRHLNALLTALISSDCRLESLRAGILGWKFFKHFTAVPPTLAHTLRNLRNIEIIIDADPNENMQSILRCRRVMEGGILRKLIRTMHQLRSLKVMLWPAEFTDEAWPAKLDDVITPGYKWPHLKDLALGGMDTTRHDLMKVLETHKETLRSLCLRDAHLGDTSWWKFLPEIRERLQLEDACICGDITGTREDDAHVVDANVVPQEYWDLSTPEVCRDNRRESINAYCRGPKAYPDECPLEKTTVDKYYEEWVGRGQPRMPTDSDDDEWEEEMDEDEDYLDDVEDYYENFLGDNDYYDQMDFVNEHPEDYDMVAYMLGVGAGANPEWIDDDGEDDDEDGGPDDDMGVD